MEVLPQPVEYLYSYYNHEPTKFILPDLGLEEHYVHISQFDSC
jgi:hypothetical protein